MRFKPPSFRIRTALLAVTGGLLFAELALWTGLWFLDAAAAGKILAMVGANHLGGRLAFIAVGLEQGFSAGSVILIIFVYNTTYVLLMYTLFIFFYEKMEEVQLFRRFIQGLQVKAEQRKKYLKNWNWVGIMFFVWIPLPWTGATIGTYIAHMEGYNSKETLTMVLPAMWVGVFSWTLWFDELYEFINRVGRGKTMFVTFSVIAIPILLYLIEAIKRAAKPPANP